MPFEAPITINPYVAAQPSPPIYVNSSGASADSPFAKPYELNSHGGTGLRTSYFPADWPAAPIKSEWSRAILLFFTSYFGSVWISWQSFSLTLLAYFYHGDPNRRAKSEQMAKI